MREVIFASKAPHFTQENQLFGRAYTLEFEWIERAQFWVMHLYDEAEQPIVLGLRLMVNSLLFVHHQGESATVFFLVPKTPNAQLNLANLQSHFMLVAHEIV